MFKLEEAAAFGRLCVETFIESQIDAGEYAAAFGRLCVETIMRCKCRHLRWGQPPSGGCVLKQLLHYLPLHLQLQPPSGGCVLKLV